jgi:hypothetical protein
MLGGQRGFVVEVVEEPANDRRLFTGDWTVDFLCHREVALVQALHVW